MVPRQALIADLLSFGQLGSPVRLLLNVKPPGYIANPLDAAGRAVSVALTDQNDHATEPRLGELQRPAGLLFAVEPNHLELANLGLFCRARLVCDWITAAEFSILPIRKL